MTSGPPTSRVISSSGMDKFATDLPPTLQSHLEHVSKLR